MPSVQRNVAVNVTDQRRPRDVRASVLQYIDRFARDAGRAEPSAREGLDLMRAFVSGINTGIGLADIDAEEGCRSCPGMHESVALTEATNECLRNALDALVRAVNADCEPGPATTAADLASATKAAEKALRDTEECPF